MNPSRGINRIATGVLALAILVMAALGTAGSATARAQHTHARAAAKRAIGGHLVGRVSSGGRTRPATAGGAVLPTSTTTDAAATAESSKPTPKDTGNPGPGLYVDAASVGGPCSDSRAAAEVSGSKPWCTLAAAANLAPSGSTVFVRGASYSQLVAPQLRAITFQGYAAERPVVAGVQVGGRGFAFRGFKFTDTVLLTNFDTVTIADNEIALTPSGSSTPNGITVTPPGSNLTVTGNYVHDGNTAVLARQPGGVSPFTNFNISGNRFEHMGGVVMQVNYGNHWVVRGNEFADNGRFLNIDPDVHPDAIHIIGADDDLLFDSNFVHSTVGGRGFLFQPTGGGTQTRVVVQNNVVVGPTSDFALRVTCGTPGMRIVNNTLAMGSPWNGTGLHLGSSQTTTTPNLVVENNIIRHFQVEPGPYGVTFAKEDNNVVDVREPNTPTPVGPHDLGGPASFVGLSAPGWNARLAPGSVGIDAADPVAAPPLDADGLARGGAPDIGAYELGGSRSATRPQERASVPHSAALSHRAARRSHRRAARTRWGRRSHRR